MKKIFFILGVCVTHFLTSFSQPEYRYTQMKNFEDGVDSFVHKTNDHIALQIFYAFKQSRSYIDISAKNWYLPKKGKNDIYFILLYKREGPIPKDITKRVQVDKTSYGYADKNTVCVFDTTHTLRDLIFLQELFSLYDLRSNMIKDPIILEIRSYEFGRRLIKKYYAHSSTGYDQLVQYAALHLKGDSSVDRELFERYEMNFPGLDFSTFAIDVLFTHAEAAYKSTELLQQKKYDIIKKKGFY